MIHTVDNPYNISLEIIDFIREGKTFTLVLQNGNKAFEMCFYPIGSTMNQGIQSYKQEKNDYEVIVTKEGKLHRLIKRHPMTETSTVNNAIYTTVRTLELSGYKLVTSTNWKVI